MPSAAGGAGGACPLCSVVVATLPLAGAQHMVVDPQRKLLYVTTGTDPNYPNALVVIDPAMMSVVKSVSLPTQPNVLGLSPDGSRLWLGIDGASAIQSVDLSTGTPVPGAQYVLPHAMYALANQTVGALTFLDGRAGSLMVTLYAGREFDGVVVLDEGIPRATPVYLAASRLAAGMGNIVYGYNDQSTGYDFYVFTVDASGFTSTTYQNLVSGFNSPLLYSARDLRVYAGSGSVVNVADPTMPIRTPGFRIFGSFALAPAAARAVMLQPASGGASLSLLDTSLFTAVSTAVMPAIPQQTLWDLGAVQSNLVAFLASDTIRNLPTELVVVKTGELR